MGPMDHAALFVPFVFPDKLDPVAGLQGLDPPADIHIVGDQQALAFRQPQQEALMPAPFVVVRQQLDHPAAGLHLNAAKPFFNGGGQRAVCAPEASGNTWAPGRSPAFPGSPDIRLDQGVDQRI